MSDIVKEGDTVIEISKILNLSPRTAGNYTGNKKDIENVLFFDIQNLISKREREKYEKKIIDLERHNQILLKDDIHKDKNYPISKNDIVMRLFEAQQDCLQALKSHIETPFKDMWDYKDWEGWARALQLAQTTDNKLSIENKAFWRYLIKEEYGREVTYRDSKGNIRTPDAKKREWIIEMFYNYLTKSFSMAREQLRKEEKDEEVK